jgi:hypothetical protein
MFLAKIKLVSALVFVALVTSGIVGLSYQATAQTRAPNQGSNPGQTNLLRDDGGPLPRANLSLADEVDALRLEIDALRKEVRATRERVKALEAERGQRQKNARMPASDPAPGARLTNIVTDLPKDAEPADMIGRRTSAPERPYDVFAEAEAALKRLRENPRDKRAAKALENASRRLNARTEVKDNEPAPRE